MPVMADQSKTHTRIVWLDYAKAIGIFFVVWGHIGGAIPYSTEIADVIYRYIFAFHMPLFFMLSGIVFGYQLPEKKKFDFRTEIQKQARKLLLPYAFWCTIYMLMDCIGSAIHGRSILSAFKNGVFDMLTGWKAPMWFLYTLFIIEMTFLQVWKLFKSKGAETSIVAWGGVLLVTAVLTVVSDGVYKHYQCDSLAVLYRYPVQMLFRSFPALFSLIAGYVGVLAASRWRTDRFDTKYRGVLTFLCAGLFFILEFTIEGIIDIRAFRFDVSTAIAMPIALLGSGTVIFAAQMLPQNLTFLQKIGRESLHIMIFHHIIIFYLNPMKIEPTIAMLWTIPAAIPYTGFVASLINLLLSYVCAVYFFEPLCRWAKARFDAITIKL